MKNNRIFILLFLMCSIISAQDMGLIKQDSLKVNVSKITWNTDPLSPSRAAFYSAVIPGLGQMYNKSYWKAPIVWGAIGTGVYFYIQNSAEYSRYELAYKSRLRGSTSDEFWGDRADGNPRLSTEGLRRAIKFYRRNKELSILVTVGLYVLNIIEANVDAHLKQFNVDERLTLEPYVVSDVLGEVSYGVSLSFNL